MTYNSVLLRSILLLSVLMSACTTTSRYTPFGVRQQAIEDAVVVIMKDGQEYTGVILATDTAALTLTQEDGKQVNLALSDILRVEHKTFSFGKTIGLVAVTIVAILIIAVRADGGIAFFPGPPTI